MKKILFLTTHNLAANPRLVKEIRLALQNNYRVEVICFVFRNWSFAINEELILELENKEVLIHTIEAGKDKIIPWFISVAKEKWYGMLARFLPLKESALANAVSRRNSLLLKEIKKIQHAEIVIGHNPGALYATRYAAIRFKSKAGFDVEDYHPGEGNNVRLQLFTKKLMKLVLPKIDYVSFPAPLIKEAIKKDMGMEWKNWVTILNYFPATEFTVPANIDGLLRLVWFSQHITAGRGLEWILPVVQKFSEKLELHLFGNIETGFYDAAIKGVDNIKLHSPLPQNSLHRQLSRFDIGLALEVANDQNRELCITNKLLAYMQAGLYIIASNTVAQKDYMEKFPLHGICIDIKKKNEIEVAFEKCIEEQIVLRSKKFDRFQNFRNTNWETESDKFRSILSLI